MPLRFPERVRTRRIALRHFTPVDAPQVQRLAGDWEVAKTTATLPHPYLDGMAEAWIAEQDVDRAAGRVYTYAITRSADGALAGALAVRSEADAHGHIGYWIGRPYWNRGYATDALRTAIDLIFCGTALDELGAIHLVDNPASGRVMEKCGMSERSRHFDDHRGERRELCMRAISRAAWKDLGAPLPYIPFAGETARLALEMLTPAHAPKLIGGLADPSLYAWLDRAPPDLSALSLRFAKISKPLARNGELWLNWALRNRDHGRYVGLVEATVYPDRHAALAYFVFANEQAKGYAAEASRAVIGHLGGDYGVTTVEITADTRNVGSQRVAEKLGFARGAEPVRAGTLRGEPAFDYRYTLALRSRVS